MNTWIQHDRRRGSPASLASGSQASWAEALLRLTDGCLAGIIFAAPLFMGGRHDLGRFVFVSLVAVAAVAWFAHQAVADAGVWIRRPVHLLLAAVGALLIVQLLPLGFDWVAKLSPRTAELLPLWSGAPDPGVLGAWKTLTLTPEATRLSLAMLTAYGLLFVTVSQRIGCHEDVARLVRWVGLSAGAIAVLGLVQFALPNGRYLWIYDHPSRSTFDKLSGPFANRNHFAHFVVLGVPALAAWLTLQVRRSPLRDLPSSKPQPEAERGAAGLLVAGLLVVAVFAVLLTCSRGGAMALLIASGVAAAGLYRAGVLQGGRIAVLALPAAAVFAAVSLVGYDSITQRLDSLVSGSLDELDNAGGRRKIWQANLAAIRAGGWFGAGAGSHAEIYPLYLDDPPNTQYTHAENGYLQIVTENGVVGGALLAAAMLAVAAWSLRAVRAGMAMPQEARAYAAAAIASLAASAAHSTCDFVWYLPACMSITLILAACAMRAGELGAGAANVEAMPRGVRLSRPAAVRLAGVMGLLGVFAVLDFAGPARASLAWDAYVRTANAQREFSQQLLTLSPADAAEALASERDSQLAALEAMIHDLQQVVRQRPAFASAHRHLANRYVQLFLLLQQNADNAMPIAQIRDSAIESRYPSAMALGEWLQRAFHPTSELLPRAQTHALAAARLSPLEGDPYLRLSELCFLQGQGYADVDAYLSQACRVRPYDGELLFDVGTQLWARNLWEPGLQCWAQAFRVKGKHRFHIAHCVAGRLSFADVAEVFAPPCDVLPQFWKTCRTTGPAEVQSFLAYAEAQTQRECEQAPAARAAALWRSLAHMHADAGQTAKSIACLEQSLQASPDDLASRRQFGLALANAGRSDEATSHLRWCADRAPDDKQIQTALSKLARDRLAASSTLPSLK